MNQSRFDREVARELLLGSTGFEWALAADFARAKAVGGLSGNAAANLRTAVECLLVGFDEPAERLLERALEWVQVAIDSGERPQRYFPNGTEALFFHTRALCNWLLLDWHDSDSFGQFVEHEDQWLANSKSGKDKTAVSIVLPTYIDAGAYERASELFRSIPRLSPPTSLVVRGEGAMAYVVSQYRLGLQYSQAEFQAIAARFLKMHVDNWLDDGHYDTAAEWMKIIHWNNSDPPISAKQALLKCYDYLPGREPPV